MTEAEYENKLREYTNRNNFWTERTINQLGYSINLFTTVGIAFLAYLGTSKEIFPKLDISCYSEFSWALALYIISIILIVLSVGNGFKSILCRLFDYRITRHLALSRKRYLTRNKNVIAEDRSKGLIDSKIIDISGLKYYPIFRNHLLGKIDFIIESDFNRGLVIEKFDRLRKESKILGDTTWRCHRWQIALFFLAIFIYGLAILS